MLSSIRFLNHNLLTSENRQISRWVSLIVIEFSFLFSEKLYSWSEDNKLLHSASIIKFLSLNHYCFINFFNYSWFPHWMNCFFDTFVNYFALIYRNEVNDKNIWCWQREIISHTRAHTFEFNIWHYHTTDSFSR